MLGQSSPLLGIVLGDLGVEVEEVFVGAPEELEFDLVVDLLLCVHPVHCSYNFIMILALPSILANFLFNMISDS